MNEIQPNLLNCKQLEQKVFNKPDVSIIWILNRKLILRPSATVLKFDQLQFSSHGFTTCKFSDYTFCSLADYIDLDLRGGSSLIFLENLIPRYRLGGQAHPVSQPLEGFLRSQTHMRRRSATPKYRCQK